MRDAHVPKEFAATPHFAPRPVRWPTDHPAARIAWEQFVFPRDLRHDGVTLLHGPINALPVAWHGKAVATILDLTFLRMPDAFNRSNRAYLAWMVRFVARRADAIIAISEATRRDAIQMLGADPHRVHRVYCGVEERFHPRSTSELAEFRSVRGLPERFILYLGTLEPRKNLVRLIEAYARLRRRNAVTMPLVVAGASGWGHHQVFARAAELGVGDDVQFVGFVPENEKPLWYNAADFFVYPSLFEGFGLPVLEALACGTPVVTSNRSSLPEIVGEAAVMVDPTSTTAIAEGIQRVIEDSALRRRLSDLGPPQASQFTWKRMASETQAVYRGVLGDS